MTMPHANPLQRLLAICLFACFTFVAMPVFADSGAQSPPAPSGDTAAKQFFDSGNELFRTGLEKAKSDPEAGRSLFRHAAAAWRAAASSGRIENAGLETNIANASLLAGDVPHAIAAYRRALEISPADSAARNGLAAARRAAGTEALSPAAADSQGLKREGGLAGSVRTIGSFLSRVAARSQEFLPPRLLLIVVCACYVGAFAFAFLRLVKFRRMSLWLPASLLALGAAAAAPMIARECTTEAGKNAVVVRAEVVARTGPADLYDAAFQEPLRPGLEVEVSEDRSGWTRVRLADGRTAWVPKDAIDRF